MAKQWRGVLHEYADRLDVTEKTPIISLGEGGTPLIYAAALSARTGAKGWVKYEGMNPTGSFKDRGMTMAISKAVEAGAKAVICASTGNTSASAAAYAVRAGLGGARRLKVEGSFDDCLEMTRKLSENSPIALVNSVTPFRLKGQKTPPSRSW